jgi:syntaxin 5
MQNYKLKDTLRRGDSTRGSQDFVSISIPQQQQQQQMQLIDQRDTYLDSRSEAIEGIEKTINELGSIFQQLTSMISAHDDLVRRFVFQHTKILCKMLFF